MIMSVIIIVMWWSCDDHCLWSLLSCDDHVITIVCHVMIMWSPLCVMRWSCDDHGLVCFLFYRHEYRHSRKEVRVHICCTCICTLCISRTSPVKIIFATCYWEVDTLTIISYDICSTITTVGVWDMRGKQFHRGVEIHSWALAVFAQYRLCPEEKLQWVVLHMHIHVWRGKGSFIWKINGGTRGQNLKLRFWGVGWDLAAPGPPPCSSFKVLPSLLSHFLSLSLPLSISYPLSHVLQTLRVSTSPN